MALSDSNMALTNGSEDPLKHNQLQLFMDITLDVMINVKYFKVSNNFD